jgi:hypothetical protein
VEPPNNVMQLTKGGWTRMAASSSAGAIVDVGGVVRPSQLITRVGPTPEEEGRFALASRL